MAYTFSFNTPPPSGFTINAATGLITIAATASPFTGNLSIRVSDGISTDIKAIAVNLVAPIVTPLISTISRSIYSCGGQMGGGAVAVTPVIYRIGGEMQAAVLEIGKNITVYESGMGQWISSIEDAQPVGVVEVTPSGLTLVPSYAVTKTGGTSWDSLSWTALNDDNHLTGAAVGDGTGQPTIVVNLGSPLTIKKIMLAGGDLDNTFSPEIAPYLNGGFLEYSNDAGTTWADHAVISGVVDIPNAFKEYNLDVTAQYWRIRRAEYIATTSFKFFT